MAPSPSDRDLQKLVFVCEDYGSAHEIIYNTKKTVCMCYLPTWLKNCNVPAIFLYSDKLYWVQDYKYLGFNFRPLVVTTKTYKDKYHIFMRKAMF